MPTDTQVLDFIDSRVTTIALNDEGVEELRYVSGPHDITCEVNNQPNIRAAVALAMSPHGVAPSLSANERRWKGEVWCNFCGGEHAPSVCPNRAPSSSSRAQTPLCECGHEHGMHRAPGAGACRVIECDCTEYAPLAAAPLEESPSPKGGVYFCKLCGHRHGSPDDCKWNPCPKCRASDYDEQHDLGASCLNGNCPLRDALAETAALASPTPGEKKYGLNYPCRCGVTVYWNNLMPEGREVIEAETGDCHHCAPLGGGGGSN